MFYYFNNFISNTSLRYLFYAVDIVLVAIFFYFLYIFMYNTKAYSIAIGIVVLAFLTFVSKILGLSTLSWIFDKFFQVVLVAIIVLFQSEIKHALRILGGPTLLKRTFGYSENNINDILTATFNLSYKGYGALIVFQRNISLHSLADRAVKLDAKISVELIESIFFKNNPLHDGAVVIVGKKIFLASAYLPLTDKELKVHNRRLGTRHRAAIGISEQTDAVVLVVSEETQGISIAHNVKLEYNLNREELQNRLGELLSI